MQTQQSERWKTFEDCLFFRSEARNHSIVEIKYVVETNDMQQPVSHNCASCHNIRA